MLDKKENTGPSIYNSISEAEGTYKVAERIDEKELVIEDTTCCSCVQKEFFEYS